MNCNDQIRQSIWSNPGISFEHRIRYRPDAQSTWLHSFQLPPVRFKLSHVRFQLAHLRWVVELIRVHFVLDSVSIASISVYSDSMLGSMRNHMGSNRVHLRMKRGTPSHESHFWFYGTVVSSPDIADTAAGAIRSWKAERYVSSERYSYHKNLPGPRHGWAMTLRRFGLIANFLENCLTIVY